MEGISRLCRPQPSLRKRLGTTGNRRTVPGLSLLSLSALLPEILPLSVCEHARSPRVPSSRSADKLATRRAQPSTSVARTRSGSLGRRSKPRVPKMPLLPFSLPAAMQLSLLTLRRLGHPSQEPRTHPWRPPTLACPRILPCSSLAQPLRTGYIRFLRLLLTAHALGRTIGR